VGCFCCLLVSGVGWLAGLSGPEAAITYAATGKSMNEQLLRSTRGYSEEQWEGVKNAPCHCIAERLRVSW